MEDTLRVCCTGEQLYVMRLNPCFNGRYSQRLMTLIRKASELSVLILVLMEDTLRVLLLQLITFLHIVLILVLMEDTLRVNKDILDKFNQQKS